MKPIEMNDRELLELLRENEEERKRPEIPGSIEFHYRHHPNLMRMTRLRSNRRGESVSKGDSQFLSMP